MGIANGWKLGCRTLQFGKLPSLMGIVNVTPDSFSDGGKFLDPNEAVEQALKLADEGASILDVGGESTRPYSAVVSTEEELNRVIPVITELCKQTSIPVSIDTSKAVVASAAINAGAEIINDVTGLEGDPKMLDIAIESGVGVCAMHMQGTPQTMQDAPAYQNIVEEIHRYLVDRKMALEAAGVEREKICLDPGIGFGKTTAHNIELMNHCSRFHDIGQPLLVGHSRKGFLGKIIDDMSADRLPATIAGSLSLAKQKIQIIRVHDVGAVKQALVAFDQLSPSP